MVRLSLTSVARVRHRHVVTPGSVAVGIGGMESGEEPRVVAARETTLQELLEGSKQYQVPLYQRTYSWKHEQLKRLWEDILKLAEDRVDAPGATHFIGSLVLAPSPSNGPAGSKSSWWSTASSA
jgi:hypothetical protein